MCKLSVVCVLFSLCLASVSFAADYSSTYKSAKDDFWKRGDDATFAQSCADKAAEAADLASNDTEKYDALVLESRCMYFVGLSAATDDDKVRIFGQGKLVAERAKNITSLQSTRAEAFYYYGINLGRWAEANGIMKSLGERHNLRRTMEAAAAPTRMAINDDGKTIPGREYDSWGCNRTLGRMYFRLPGMFGGDNAKAEKLLREAYEKTPQEDRNSLTVYYLAEVLVANGEKDEARRILDEVIQYEGDLSKYNPRRVPETRLEMNDIKALRHDLGD